MSVVPFLSVQAAELADLERKRFETLRAICARLGAALYRRTDDAGHVTYRIGLRNFESIGAAEDFVDTIGEEAPP